MSKIARRIYEPDAEAATPESIHDDSPRERIGRFVIHWARTIRRCPSGVCSCRAKPAGRHSPCARSHFRCGIFRIAAIDVSITGGVSERTA